MGVGDRVGKRRRTNGLDMGKVEVKGRMTYELGLGNLRSKNRTNGWEVEERG